MRVSYRWLSEYVDLNGYSAGDLAELLTRSGIEVDVVEKLNKGVRNVVVGYVKECDRHPDADKLRVCRVDVGQSDDLQIVCGAPNVAAGQKVPVALVGAELPGGVEIKKAKLRGVESHGMICSARELGLNEKLLPKEEQDGILVLPEEAEIGRSVTELLAIDDEVLELDLTPNRSDCLSMIGVAYEIAAVLGRGVKLPEAPVASSSFRASDQLNVSIEAADLCPHYTARVIRGVKVGPSPLWMRNRLTAAGIRTINNVVDITNYVMLEYGQPLHAFDAGKLEGGRIVVRRAREGERITTLDGQLRELTEETLVIADAVKPVAIAGVMGGANSEVDANTAAIVLESARFAGGEVRRTSRRLGLRSESSLRFEKEVNPDYVIQALNRAASLIQQYAGGEVAEGVAEAGENSGRPRRIAVSVGRINGYLGTQMSAAEVSSIFDRLQFPYADGQEDGEWTVEVPPRRGDITRDVDLIEEVARLYGYDNIPASAIRGVTTPGSLTPAQTVRRIIRRLLTGAGLHETVQYTFAHPEHLRLYPGLYPDAKPIRLSLPMSEERSVLRTSLIPHLLETARYNRNRSERDIRIFEMGSVFLTDEDRLTKLPEEKPMLAALMTGTRQAAHWSGRREQSVDFYDIKGILEMLFAHLGIRNVRYAASSPEGLHPGRAADICIGAGGKETAVGRIGQLHPELERKMDLEAAYIFELDLSAVTEAADFSIAYVPAPRHPSVARDVAVVVDEAVEAAGLLQAAKEAAGAYLESADIFDVFADERLGGGRKSVALSLVYRHPERTWTDEEVAELHGKVVAALEQRCGARMRT